MTRTRLLQMTFCLMTAVLTGCSSISALKPAQESIASEALCPETVAVNPDGREILVTDKAGRVTPEYIRAMIEGEASIDTLLDCALSPAITEESKLYRGHVLLSLLAQYGAYNLQIGPYEERIGDAITLLAHIKQAEYSLRGPSSVVKPDVIFRRYQERPARLDRITYVLEVALYAERPTLRRLKGRVGSLVGSIASGASTESIRWSLKGAIDGIEKSIHLRLYGKAYLDDAKEDLSRFTGEGQLPEAADWQRRDAMIEEACDQIAKLANLNGYSCIPEESDGG
ncbi:MAG: hypothetical protein P8103_01740 [Candidatus Thiodiazotropha sp.]